MSEQLRVDEPSIVDRILGRVRGVGAELSWNNDRWLRVKGDLPMELVRDVREWRYEIAEALREQTQLAEIDTCARRYVGPPEKRFSVRCRFCGAVGAEHERASQ